MWLSSVHRGPRSEAVAQKKLCGICTNCHDGRITVEYTLNAQVCVSTGCELRMCYQSFDQEMCIQTNPVILQHRHSIYDKRNTYVCGLVTHQFRIIEKTK